MCWTSQIRPDATAHLHQLCRPELARGRRSRRLHDGRDRQIKEDDMK